MALPKQERSWHLLPKLLSFLKFQGWRHRLESYGGCIGQGNISVIGFLVAMRNYTMWPQLIRSKFPVLSSLWTTVVFFWLFLLFVRFCFDGYGFKLWQNKIDPRKHLSLQYWMGEFWRAFYHRTPISASLCYSSSLCRPSSSLLFSSPPKPIEKYLNSASFHNKVQETQI